ncbi:MAG: hypothetical protein KKA05_02090 [Alphaproteobacteria bacterium]|nr:hypothetical protein [Alphaproteobacteria bacterium]
MMKAVLLLALLAVTVVFAQGVNAAAQAQVQARKDTGAKIRALTPDALQKLIADAYYGPDAATLIDDINMDYVTVDDVVIVGILYTLVFVSADDTPGWAQFKDLVPPQVAQQPGFLPSDEQALEYLKKLSQVAKQNFEALAAKDFANNKDKFRTKYPAEWTDEQLLMNVSEEYQFNGNTEIAPESQRAYNEYMALLQLLKGLELYQIIKEKL